VTTAAARSWYGGAVIHMRQPEASQILAVADAWWSQDLGCTVRELRPSATRVQEHRGGLLGSTNIWILVLGEHPVVSLPPEALALTARAERWSRTQVATPANLLADLGTLGAGRIERIVGPAFIGYGLEGLHLEDSTRARVLTAEDAPALARLRASCGVEEWEHGGSDRAAGGALFGAYEAGELVAVASYKVWGERLAHIAIATKPARRGRGFGKAAVALAAKRALEAGLVPQYRTLRSNSSSLAIARHLGFVDYGFSVAVRLRPFRST
jgi:GNAT superfamily N-acetyltransferase